MRHAAFDIGALVTMLCLAASVKAQMRAECPQNLPARAIKTVRAPEGWVGTIPGPIYLDAAGMMAGPPDSMLYLVPDKTTANTQTFEFAAGDRQRWLWCTYGGTQLARHLDNAATQCVVTSRAAKAGAPMTAAVECH
jgi:hypothetical protein